MHHNGRKPQFPSRNKVEWWEMNFLCTCVKLLVNMVSVLSFLYEPSFFKSLMMNILSIFTRLETTVGCAGRTATVTNSGSSTSPQKSTRTACSTRRMTRTAGSIASPREFSKSVSGEFSLNLQCPSAATNVDTCLIDVCLPASGSSRVRAPMARCVLWPTATRSWRSGWTAENFYWWNSPKPERITWSRQTITTLANIVFCLKTLSKLSLIQKCARVRLKIVCREYSIDVGELQWSSLQFESVHILFFFFFLSLVEVNGKHGPGAAFC